MSKLPLSYFIENELLEMIGGYIWIYFPHFKKTTVLTINYLKFEKWFFAFFLSIFRYLLNQFNATLLGCINQVLKRKSNQIKCLNFYLIKLHPIPLSFQGLNRLSFSSQ